MKLGKKLGGTARASGRWAEVLAHYGHLLPPYPGEAVLEPVRTPAPPLLDAKAALHRNAVELAGVYTALMPQLAGKAAPAFASPLKHDRHYVVLLAAARELVAKRIPPAAWVKFSLDVFWRYIRRRAVPKPGWVFSLKRLQERVDWFSWAESFNTAQAVVWVAPEHHKLLRAYESMRRELLRSTTLTASLVQEIVDDHLPRHLYEELSRGAQDKYAGRRRKMQQALEAGKWIW